MFSLILNTFHFQRVRKVSIGFEFTFKQKTKGLSDVLYMEVPFFVCHVRLLTWIKYVQ